MNALVPSGRTVWTFALLLAASVATAIEPPPAGDPAPPVLAPASSEGEDALQGFRIPEGWQGQLFAAEPMVANPVAFHLDYQGRLYLCETFRQNRGITDNRGHDQAWLDDDLASQSVEDRLAFHLKHLKEKAVDYTRYDDRIRVLEDRNGDGRADFEMVFADRFNSLVEGTGAGILVRNGDVYYTCIPNLWLLRDETGDGRADVRRSLSYGYGARVAFRGHDLHGLTLGPDGMLYFSIGDRGYNVETADGRRLADPESGAVFRCNLDGSELEVVATGLRNPQELAFDDYGNLFTGDNNSDSGDKARWIYVVEGADYGWRMAYQYLSDRGPYNREKIWHPYHEGQPAYIVPPVANIADGPAGLDYYPGTGLSDDWKGFFFLCDFRGTPSNSGIRAFRVEPQGAFFDLVDAQQPIWNILATDVQFAPDGSVYVSDWVQGWNGEGKGRIYRFFDPRAKDVPLVRETARLLAEGMKDRPAAELTGLLGHADRRVRMEAQFELAQRRDAATLTSRLAPASNGADELSQLARLHAVWGLGQIARQTSDSAVLEPVLALLGDSDAEVRAQAAHVIGRAAVPSAAAELIERLRDESPRVRYFAAQALGQIAASRSGSRKTSDGSTPVVRGQETRAQQGQESRAHQTVRGRGTRAQQETRAQRADDPTQLPNLVTGSQIAAALADLLSENDNRDPIVRHGGIMGLTGIHDAAVLEPLAIHSSPAVRLATVVAMRKRSDPAVARFLTDLDPRIVVEAASAIHDVPLTDALPQLAALISRPTRDEALLRRVLNANLRLGGPDEALAVAEFATRDSVPQAMRIEALRILGEWADPSSRDRVLGMWRPVSPRGADAAVAAVKRALPGILTAPDEVRNEGVQVAAKLGIREIGPTLHAILADPAQPSTLRADVLDALAAVSDADLDGAIRRSLSDGDPRVRDSARRALTAQRLDEALPLLAAAVEADSMIERQGALATLATLDHAGVESIIADALGKLLAGSVPADTRLDVLEAAAARSGETVRKRLADYEATRKDDSPNELYREALFGGDAERGRRIFFERTEVSCLRCHKVDEVGGEVGPNLSKIAAEKPREYLLEAIVDPNRAIAKGFESVMLLDEDGLVHVGIIKHEDDRIVEIMTAEGTLKTIPQDAIEVRRAAKSAMPEDLIKHLSRKDIRDLVEYLSQRK